MFARVSVALDGAPRARAEVREACYYRRGARHRVSLPRDTQLGAIGDLARRLLVEVRLPPRPLVVLTTGEAACRPVT